MKAYYVLAKLPFTKIEEQEGEFLKIKYEGENVWCGDEYHKIEELYEHRMALNIALFNIVHNVSDMQGASFRVMKSFLHNDGTMFEGYFIVMMETPFGQISYHYKIKHWNKFQIPAVERTPPWDGHNPADCIERLMKL